MRTCREAACLQASFLAFAQTHSLSTDLASEDLASEPSIPPPSREERLQVLQEVMTGNAAALLEELPHAVRHQFSWAVRQGMSESALRHRLAFILSSHRRRTRISQLRAQAVADSSTSTHSPTTPPQHTPPPPQPPPEPHAPPQLPDEDSEVLTGDPEGVHGDLQGVDNERQCELCAIRSNSHNPFLCVLRLP